MVDPFRASKAPLSSRIALPIALLLAGMFGFGISMTQPYAALTGAVSPGSEKSPETSTTNPLPDQELQKNQEEAGSPGALEGLVDFCSKGVTPHRSFVIFKRGTCVIVDEPCKNPKMEAQQILAKCAETAARFVAEVTTEGDVIVAFKAPVFHRFDSLELQKLKPWLSRFATALLTPEETVAAGDDWVPPDRAQIGLFARRRLLEDAVNAEPVRVIRAKE
jgi:hypothetical protein